MARDQIDMTPIETRDELVAWLEAGCKPKEQFRVGTEHEKFAFTVADHRARQLADVTRALEDINAGRYGICRECGEAIAKARLKAMPFATRCVACQARSEGVERAA